MARSLKDAKREKEETSVIEADGVVITVISGRAKLSIVSKSKAIMKVVEIKRLTKEPKSG